MATKTFYGKKNEIEDVEKLLIEIDSKIYPEKKNHMTKIVKGLKLLKNDISQKSK